jgi:tetratricopeptide (TPR) repeat protein
LNQARLAILGIAVVASVGRTGTTGFSRNLAALHLVHSSRLEPTRTTASRERVPADAVLAQAEFGRLARAASNPHIEYLWGVASLNAGDPHTSILAFTHAIQSGADPYMAYQKLGTAYQRAEKPEPAVSAWRASGDLRPALTWGRAMLKPGGTDEARAVFRAMAQVGDENYYRPEALYHAAIAWEIDGRWDLALVVLEQVNQLRPDHPATLVDLARALYYTGGDADRAEALIARADELAPRNEWIATVVTDLYSTVGDTERRARWGRRLEELRAGAPRGQ